MWFSQHHSFTGESVCSQSLAPSSQIVWLYMLEVISGLSILFHRSVYLFLHQYCTVLIADSYSFVIWFEISLKSGNEMPQALCFFLKIALSIWRLLWPYTNFRIVGSCSVKKCSWNLDRDYFESVDCFGWYGHFQDILLILIFLFMCVFFSFFY